MLVDLRLRGREPVAVPPPLVDFVEKVDAGLIVRGDPVLATEIFLYVGGSSVVVATRLPELIDHLNQRGVRVAIDDFGLTSILHHGLVPVPHTEYRDIKLLAMGDTAAVTGDGDTARLDLSFDYPWFSDKSREDRNPSKRALLDLLTRAVDREVSASGGRGFLMLSSGKDSTAIALGLAEAGHADIPCVTYANGPDDCEALVASDVCKRLGLTHQIVQLPRDPAVVAQRMTHFFENSSRPGGDLAQIPYVLAVAEADAGGGAVFDGGGNDTYMGFPISGHWRKKMLFRVRSRWLADRLQRRVDVDSPLNYLARSRPTASLPGRTPRFHEIREFMPTAVDTSTYWNEIAQETRSMTDMELFAAVMVRQVMPAASMKKHVLAAEAYGYDYRLPWCDPEIADYYFNLPEGDRYNLTTGENKVLLRGMLRTYLDYDAAEVGKHYFSFQGARFVVDNMEFVRAEINSCELWDREGLAIVDRWLERVERRPLLYHAILAVFMMSGWYNHSRYLTSFADQAAGIRNG